MLTRRTNPVSSSSSSSSSSSCCCFCCCCTCGRLHASQWVWFRMLFMATSRYSYINTYDEVKASSAVLAAAVASLPEPPPVRTMAVEGSVWNSPAIYLEPRADTSCTRIDTHSPQLQRKQPVATRPHPTHLLLPPPPPFFFLFLCGCECLSPAVDLVRARSLSEALLSLAAAGPSSVIML